MPDRGVFLFESNLHQDPSRPPRTQRVPHTEDIRVPPLVPTNPCLFLDWLQLWTLRDLKPFHPRLCHHKPPLSSRRYAHSARQHLRPQSGTRNRPSPATSPLRPRHRGRSGKAKKRRINQIQRKPEPRAGRRNPHRGRSQNAPIK